MDKYQFTQLQQLINQNRVSIEVTKSYSNSVFGGQIGNYLFTLIALSGLIFITALSIKNLYLYAILVIVSLIIFAILWFKLAFYYFHIRSLRNYEFFNSAYTSNVIQLQQIYLSFIS